jgi:hypothetical protein
MKHSMFPAFALAVLPCVAQYTSPSCGPTGGSKPWACGAWPSTVPPKLGAAGTKTIDADTGARVLRATQPGSFGEGATYSFKTFDAGWKQAWNANSTRFSFSAWGGVARVAGYWYGFNASSMLLGATGSIPLTMNDWQWDQNNPDLVVGLSGGAAKGYNVVTRAYSILLDPKAVQWPYAPWLSSYGGNRVCLATGPQDVGYRILCADRGGANVKQIDLHAQTINGKAFPVTFKGAPVKLPQSIGNHTITLARDGRWLAIDTHGNSMCSISGLANYASTSLFINLDSGVGYEWNIACGGTHWAYGYDGLMMQSTSPNWSPKGNQGPCKPDSRGVARRKTDGAADSSFEILGPCSFYSGSYAANIHLSWMNNRGANLEPVILSALGGVGLLTDGIDAMEVTMPVLKNRVWRFARTWNDQTKTQCSLLEYASPSVSPDGKWAVYPSDWRGQTGIGTCTNRRRTDVFVFELK